MAALEQVVWMAFEIVNWFDVRNVTGAAYGERCAHLLAGRTGGGCLLPLGQKGKMDKDSCPR